MTRYELTPEQAHGLAFASGRNFHAIHCWIESEKMLGATIEVYAEKRWFWTVYAIGVARVGVFVLDARKARRYLAENGIQEVPHDPATP